MRQRIFKGLIVFLGCLLLGWCFWDDTAYADVDEKGALEYVVLEKTSVQKGGEQNIVVGLGGVEDELIDATLNYENCKTGEKYGIEYSNILDNAVLFTMQIEDEFADGEYKFTEFSYATERGQGRFVFKDEGLDLVFGVNIEVETKPDAYVFDEEEVDTDIIVFNEDGEQVVADTIEDALMESMAVQKKSYGSNGNVVIVLDPGHDSTHHGASANGLKEEELTLKIAKYCREELNTYNGVTVYMTRNDDGSCPYPGTTSGDCNESRVAYAKSVGANAYVSIHLNSAENSSASGVEVYYPNGNYNSTVGSQGKELAQDVLDKLVELGLKNRGIKIRSSENGTTYEDGSLADYYGVIRNSKKQGIPAVIIEHAFLTNTGDVNDFLNNDAGLKRLGVADAEGIAKCYGLTKGYDVNEYKDVFDANYYASKYSDVKAAYGTDETKLLKHFVEYGMSEGRQGNAEFDVFSYKRQYFDLRTAFGDDLKSYYIHYINYGKAEGRDGTGCATIINPATVYNGIDYSNVYNYYFYINQYTDVAASCGENDVAALEHFVKYGMSEGRQGCEGFNVWSYRYQYPDLRIAYGNDMSSYYMHYLYYGVYEKRNGTGCTVLVDPVTVYNGVDYGAVYDFSYYITKYSDVRKAYGADDVSVLKHFVEYGMAEQRQANANFDVRSYRLQYTDLRMVYGDDWEGYYRHYIYYGMQEGRNGTGCTMLINPVTIYEGVDYSSVYDYNYYVTTYGDIRNMYGANDIAVLEHFVKYGMAEQRQGIKNFNAYRYRQKYGDLAVAYGDDWKAYYLHYMNYGKAEGRNCD